MPGTTPFPWELPEPPAPGTNPPLAPGSEPKAYNPNGSGIVGIPGGEPGAKQPGQTGDPGPGIVGIPETRKPIGDGAQPAEPAQQGHGLFNPPGQVQAQPPAVQAPSAPTGGAAPTRMQPQPPKMASSNPDVRYQGAMQRAAIA